jgi:hypothetical protein
VTVSGGVRTLAEAEYDASTPPLNRSRSFKRSKFA